MNSLRFIVTAIAIIAAIGVAEFLLWCSIIALGDWVRGWRK